MTTTPHARPRQQNQTRREAERRVVRLLRSQDQALLSAALSCYILRRPRLKITHLTYARMGKKNRRRGGGTADARREPRARHAGRRHASAVIAQSMPSFPSPGTWSAADVAWHGTVPRSASARTGNSIRISVGCATYRRLYR